MRYLGVVYNPIHNTFGRVPVVVFDKSEVQIDRDISTQFELIAFQNEAQFRSTTSAQQLKLASKAGNFAASDQPSTSASPSANAWVYKGTKLIGIARLETLVPTLSRDMIEEIEKLPPWSIETHNRYARFFTTHGTHVNTSVALGGTLRITWRADTALDQAIVEQALNGHATALNLDISPGVTISSVRQDAMQRALLNLERTGGGVVTTELTRALEDLSKYLHGYTPDSKAPQNWTDARTRWMDALRNDPALCSDVPETEYLWLHSFNGITERQKDDLQRASEHYLQNTQASVPRSSNVDQAHVPSAGHELAKAVMTLPRRDNLIEVDDLIRDEHESFWARNKIWLIGGGVVLLGVAVIYGGLAPAAAVVAQSVASRLATVAAAVAGNSVDSRDKGDEEGDEEDECDQAD
jgi:hypothetical protein